jgi:peptide/nickel transport system substrate-binding protein
MRVRVAAAAAVLVVVGVGGWQLLPSRADTGRTITVGTTDVVTSLDPAGAYDAGSWSLFSNVFQSLLTFEPGGVTPVPDAAKSCVFVGTEQRTYRCTLRDGLTFPSGREVTAADVKYSFDRVKGINSEVGPAALLDTLASVDAKGMTVTFHLSSSDATFPFKVATGAGSIVDRTKYPRHSLRSGTEVDGTGPYTLTTYTKNKRAVLAPNSHYEGAVSDTGRPIVLRYYATPDALEKGWKAKRIDVATRSLPPAALAGLAPSDPDKHVTEADSAAIRLLVLNTKTGSPLHSARVREAVAALVNREKLVNDVYENTTDPLYSLIPAGITGHTTSFFDDNPQPSTAKARSLLTQAGVRTPVRFTLGYGKGRGSAAQEAAELKRQLEATGLFKVDVTGYEWTDFQKRYAEGKLDAWTIGWVADFPDPDTFSAPLVGTGNTLKNGYSSKAVDRLIKDSELYEDRAKAESDFEDLQTIIARDVPLIPLWQEKEYVVSSEDVGGGQYVSDGTGVFRLWRLSWI